MLKENFRESKEIMGNSDAILVTSKRFVTSMANEIIKHPETETGGYILGLRDAKDPARTFLVTIGGFTPDNPEEIVRASGHLNIGGEICDNYRKWQLTHWPTIYPSFYRDFPFDPKDAHTKLSLIGIWHKHPASLLDYSLEDDSTINYILDLGKEDFLFPILILRKKDLITPPTPANKVLRIEVDDNYYIDATFYHRSSKNRKTNILQPEIYCSGLFPVLAPEPWIVNKPELYKREQEALSELGVETELQLIRRREISETEIWLVLKHKDLPGPIYLKTSPTFHLDRKFFVKFCNPTDDRDADLGMVLPDTKPRTMADQIESIFLFLIEEQQKYERAKLT